MWTDEDGKVSSKRMMAFMAFLIAFGFSMADIWVEKALLDSVITWLSASAGFAGVSGFQSAFKGNKKLIANSAPFTPKTK